MEATGAVKDAPVIRELLDEALIARRRKSTGTYDSEPAVGQEIRETLHTIQSLLLKLISGEELIFLDQNIGLSLLREALIEARSGREIDEDDRVKPILWNLCEKKKADEFVFVNPKTKKPYTDVKRSFGTACDLADLRNVEWHDLRATFCTRLDIAGYDAFTIKALMGHRDMKTTEKLVF